jgi:acetyltransferase
MCEYPEKYENYLTLKNNESIFIRPLKAADRPLIVELLGSLSERSKYLRFFMNLRSFPDGLLDRLMDMDYDSNFALAGVVSKDGKHSIIAVARYSYSCRQLRRARDNG